jgi:hypothetical protein
VVDPEPARFAIKGGSKQDWRAGIRKFSIERPLTPRRDNRVKLPR